MTELTGIVLLMTALGYAGGMFHGWWRANQANAAFERKIAQAHEQHTALERARDRALEAHAAAVALSQLYEGFRQVQLGLDALDARNFGTAEAHVRDAEGALVPLAPRVSDLAPIVQRLAQTDVEVAGDLGAQRQALANIAEKLDALIARERATR